MKRESHIIEKIIEWGNLQESFDTVVRGTLRKSLREGRWLIAHRDEFLAGVREEIIAGHLNLRGFHEKIITEGGKVRHIQVFNMADRIKINAVMKVVDECMRRRFIRTSGASIKGRGMHDLMQYIKRDIEDDPAGTRYCYTFDIKKCYESTSQEVVRQSIRKVFKDKRLIGILDEFVGMMPKGMSLGMRSSQGLVNLVISIHLDHVLKSQHGIRHYYRYCDNGEILGGSKQYLWYVRGIVHDCLEPLGYVIHDERIFPVEDGIDALGYKIYPDHVMLRKRIKQKFARAMCRVKSRKRRMALVASFYGMAKHGNCHNLMKELLTPTEMKKFSELKISYTPADGKKRFPNRAVQLRQLINVEIEVMDFERDVKTKYGLRTLVKFRDTRTNEIAKFFTDCDEMKCALKAAEEMGAIPFSTVIGVEYFGNNKAKYKFI